jgi:hypothetical protein
LPTTTFVQGTLIGHPKGLRVTKVQEGQLVKARDGRSRS